MSPPAVADGVKHGEIVLLLRLVRGWRGTHLKSALCELEAVDVRVNIVVGAADAQVVQPEYLQIINVVGDVDPAKANLVDQTGREDVGFGQHHETVAHGQRDRESQIAGADRSPKGRSQAAGAEWQEGRKVGE